LVPVGLITVRSVNYILQHNTLQELNNPICKPISRGKLLV
jgi:hypothetical protein